MLNSWFTNWYRLDPLLKQSICCNPSFGRGLVSSISLVDTPTRFMVFGFGTPNVQKMSEKLDVEGLIKALGYKKDSDVRRKAAKALSKIGDSRAVEPLMRALNDSDSRVRSWATTSLSKIGEPALKPLIKALNDSDSGVRSAAAKALGEIGDYRAVEPLTKALDDTCVDVSTSAKEALHKMGMGGGCG